MKAIYTLILTALLTAAAFCQALNKQTLDTLVAEAQKTHTDALVIHKDGQEAYKNYFGKDVKPIEAMSATKSVVAIGIALLLDKGHLKTLDEPVSTFYPEWKQGRKAKITVRHLLEHTSGLQNLANAGIEVEGSPDGVQLALAAELETEPGAVFSYNNKATNLLAGVIEKASGEKMDVFIKRHVFDKLGITNFEWRHDKKGNPIGMAGLMILPEDLVKIGQMMLDKGMWKGERILSEARITEMTKPGSVRPENGLLWWLLYDRQLMVLDDDFLTRVKARATPEALELFGRVKGRYETSALLQAKMRTVMNEAEFAKAMQAFSQISSTELRIENEGDVMGYMAVGYLGQYLIVLPKKNMVVVRMITSQSFQKIPNNSSFAQIRTLVKSL